MGGGGKNLSASALRGGQNLSASILRGGGEFECSTLRKRAPGCVGGGWLIGPLEPPRNLDLGSPVTWRSHWFIYYTQNLFYLK